MYRLALDRDWEKCHKMLPPVTFILLRRYFVQVQVQMCIFSLLHNVWDQGVVKKNYADVLLQNIVHLEIFWICSLLWECAYLKLTMVCKPSSSLMVFVVHKPFLSCCSFLLRRNPDVQAECLDYGTLPLLLQLLSESSYPASQRRALFAISALVRFFPAGQAALWRSNGLAQLRQLCSSGNRTTTLCTKAVTLLYDLLVEEVRIDGCECDII